MRRRFQKSWNQLYLVRLIRAYGQISQAELALKTKLQPSTVSNLMRDLKEHEVVMLTGKGESGKAGGKKSDLLSLNPDYGTFSGMFVKQDSISELILDFAGNVLEQKVEMIEDRPANDLVKLISDRIKEASINRQNYRGAGISVQSVVSYGGDITPSLDFNWSIPRFVEMLHEETPIIPMVIENDANCSAYYAYLLLKEKYRNLITFSIYSHPFTMGGGIIMGGELYKGACGAAGEIWERDLEFWQELNRRNCQSIEALQELDLYDKYIEELQNYILSAAVFLDTEAVVLDGDFAQIDQKLVERFLQSLSEKNNRFAFHVFKEKFFTIKGASCLAADRSIPKELEMIFNM